MAELAEDFFRMLGQLTATSSAELLCQLPLDVDASQRTKLLLEFEAGRAHFAFCYVLKLSHLHNAPHAIFKMANLDTAVAWQAADLCMTSHSSHPRVRRLQSPALREQYERWKRGDDLFSEDLQDLAEFIAELRFAFSTDRPGEALHRNTRHIGSRGTHRSNLRRCTSVARRMHPQGPVQIPGTLGQQHNTPLGPMPPSRSLRSRTRPTICILARRS